MEPRIPLLQEVRDHRGFDSRVYGMPFDCVSFGSREMLILAQDFFIYGMVGAVRKRRRLLDKLTV